MLSKIDKNRLYRERNRKAIRTRARAAYARDITKSRASKRAESTKYRAANMPKIRAAARRFRAEHREEYRKYHREYARRRSGVPEPARPAPALCECCAAKRKLVVDHDHATGAFRGWLCDLCNMAIGLLGDTAEGVGRAVRYLT